LKKPGPEKSWTKRDLDFTRRDGCGDRDSQALRATA